MVINLQDCSYHADQSWPHELLKLMGSNEQDNWQIGDYVEEESNKSLRCCTSAMELLVYILLLYWSLEQGQSSTFLGVYWGYSCIWE